MMNSKLLSKILQVVSFLGFADATYLTLEHFLNRIPPCSIGGCETVLTSDYAVIAGIPLAVMGMLFYLTVFFMVTTGKTQWLKLFVSIGFAVSLLLLGLQAFVIHAFCLYCLGSLTTSTLLYIFVCLRPGNST